MSCFTPFYTSKLQYLRTINALEEQNLKRRNYVVTEQQQMWKNRSFDKKQPRVDLYANPEQKLEIIRTDTKRVQTDNARHRKLITEYLMKSQKQVNELLKYQKDMVQTGVESAQKKYESKTSNQPDLFSQSVVKRTTFLRDVEASLKRPYFSHSLERFSSNENKLTETKLNDTKLNDTEE